MMTDLKRIIKSGFVNFQRGGIVSWAAVLVTTITLSVIVGIILLQTVLFFSLAAIKDKVDVTIYFTVGAPEDKIMLLKSSLEKLPEVQNISYVSAAESLRIFRERHERDYPTIQALDEIGTNPLGAYLNIKAKEVNQYESISNFLQSDNALVTNSSNIIDKVNYHQNKVVIERLNSIISGAQKLGFIVTFLFIVVSVIITFNTIRLTIFISREEISVMRLVGASKIRVNGPFMVEGAIYGIISTLITMVIFWPVTAWFGRNMTGFLGLDLYGYYTSNFIQIFGITLLSGIFLGMLSSYIAARKYLNK
ncbi:MAG: permease-like cell division protein FtsX [Candidatus Pacebacteria bacterium]|nr:permease-like cell division protein FtsX [Candidatus Paceibacterota bacterium]